ncbi:IS3 family transposase [Paenibacillus agricola]|uniref:IS3 family transposase n=1 Tax=Paenibacillus agricola TaxID=2716264 RepID=A0ABX0JIC2_9BACL|nr:IS3 family transposase [Paenibacillus agricola]NHN35616.1 IS3 family transposase [Paenibacillus agricola]
MKYQLLSDDKNLTIIYEHRSEYRLEKMCRIMNVSRSGYYKWLGRPESNRERQHKEWTGQVKEVYERSRQIYGSPKVTQQLKKNGISISERTVTRIMKANGIRSKTVKKYKATTNSKHSLPVQENVLNREFTASKPNEKWVTDITYVSTNEGWFYLASVMDLFSRKIVGWHMSERMTKELVLQALKQAYGRQHPGQRLLHHSDRGSQYASLDYQKQLQLYGMVGSMSRKGNCYDNACIESFHSVLKKEWIYLHKYETREEAKKSIFEYIEVFYNNQRIHSSIGYNTPSDYERTFQDLAV